MFLKVTSHWCPETGSWDKVGQILSPQKKLIKDYTRFTELNRKGWRICCKSRSFNCYCNATIRLLFLHNRKAKTPTPLTHCWWFCLDISWDVLVLQYGLDWKLFAVWNASNYILYIGPVPQSCHYWSHTLLWLSNLHQCTEPVNLLGL